MAAPISSSVSPRGLALHTLAASPRRCGGAPVISVSPHAHRQSPLIGSAMSSSGMSMTPIKGTTTTRIRAVDPASAADSLAGAADLLGGKIIIPLPELHLHSVLSWIWMFGAATAAAVPLYRRFRKIEETVEGAAETAIHMIDSAAEAAEKAAEEVAGPFPGNETLKNAASKIKAIADEIEEDVDKAEALLDKVDEIEEKLDSIVDKVAKDMSDRRGPTGGDK